jgi:mono/diheme cytochrome c family protein
MIGRWRLLVAAFALLLLTLFGPAQGQERARPSAVPAWASIEGWGVFVESGCGRCHSLRARGGGRAFDLAALPARTGFFEMAAAVWNHVPRLGAQMWATGVERRITPSDLSALLGFIFTAQYLDVSGDPAAGQRLFSRRGCAGCHELGDNGGAGRAALGGLEKSDSAVILAAAMWNHGPPGAERMRITPAARPNLGAGELRHLVAHIVRSARVTDAAIVQIVADTPRRGARVFTAKGCAGCHKSGLGPAGRHMSLSDFAERMWNHGPAIEAARRRGALPAPLTGQDMAALVGHLFVSRYFDTWRGDGSRGKTLLGDKRCLSCHAVYGRGGKLAPDLATSNVVSSVDGQLAAMWNHGRLMEMEARRLTVSLPELSARDLADIATYLGRLAKRPVHPR